MSDDLFLRLADVPHQLQSFAPGASVFRLGDAVEQIHFVQSGTIHLLRTQADGSELILQRAQAGDILAEASLHSPLYHCEAKAASHAVTRSVARRHLRARLAADPDLAEAWARKLAHEIQQRRMQVEIMSLRTVAARLDAWIAWRGALPDKGQWSSLAAEIGVSPEALYRELARRRPRRAAAPRSTISGSRSAKPA